MFLFWNLLFISAVAMNYRGIDLNLLTARMHCSTDHEDLALVVNHIKKLYPEHRIFAVGTSIGKRYRMETVRVYRNKNFSTD
jgi:predicted alpha/beta-fold hydrolase